MSQEQQIIDGARVQAFLDDPSVQAAFAKVREDAFKTFLGATKAEERETAHAIASAAEKLQQVLRATVDSGVRAEFDLGKRQKPAPAKR